jgi:EAL domain-containing protein (putative c-di-GMP-specific phosphodiesterase class I)
MGCVTEWVLRKSCEQAYEWQQKGYNIRVGVNITASDFQRLEPTLVKTTHEILDEIKTRTEGPGLDPSLIKLEITERMVIDNPKQAISTMKKLKELSIGIDIDDFGTGTSGLSLLSELPADIVKLDKKFMRNIGPDPSKAEPEHVKLVEAIINMAHEMGKKVVQEGVETKEQFDLLQSLGCDFAQGYYKGNGLGEARPAEEMEKALEKQGLAEEEEVPAADRQIWRDVTYTEEMLLSLIEEMLSLGFNKEVVLAFDSQIGADQAVNPLDSVLAALANLKQNPKFKKMLKKLKIITASPGNMRSAIEKEAGKDAEVFVFARRSEQENLSGLERDKRVHATYIGEIDEEGKEFGNRAYYPLAEMVVISIAQAIAPVIAGNEATAVLKVPGLEDINLNEINIESVILRDNTLLFTLLPDAKELDKSELMQRYAALKRFLKAA